MKRREFITLIRGPAAGPLVAQAQQPERMRRVGVLMHTAADEPEAQARLAAFLQGLQETGWEVSRNIRVDTRWSTGDLARLHKDAAELVATRPDVILAGVGGTHVALQQAPRTLAVVFAQGLETVGTVFIANMARAGCKHSAFIQ